jgi:hypothetical protein
MAHYSNWFLVDWHLDAAVANPSGHLDYLYENHILGADQWARALM